MTENKDKERIQQEYDEMNRQFEEDRKTHDYSDPEMDKWFYETLDQECKKDRRRKILNVAGIAATIILAVGLALNGFTQVTYGESLIDIVKYSIEAGQFTITRIGNKNDNNQQFEEYDSFVIQYESDSIENLFEQIMNDIHTGIDTLFCLKNTPSEYSQWIAKYNMKFQTLTIHSRNKDNCLYIYEDLNYENVASGTLLEADVVSSVFNENLQININIIRQMEQVRNQGYYLEVFYNDKRLKIEGDGTLQDFEVMVRNIALVKGN